MRSIHILYGDPFLKMELLTKSLLNIYSLESIIIRDLFRNELIGQGELKNEINGYLTNGNLVPTETLEKMIDYDLKKRTKDVLMIGYPLTVEQFLSFKLFAEKEKLSISTIWYFKINDFKAFMERKFKEEDEKKWHDKFGDEMRETWTQKHDEFEIRMKDLIGLSNCAWTTIELDYSEDSDIGIIERRIKNSVQQRL
jgi:adenylate kinase family enzyme